MPPKGKKMNLGEFLGKSAVVVSDLPEAPSGIPDPRFQRNADGEWERMPYRGRDEDEDEGPSRADEDDMWRRGPVGGPAGHDDDGRPRGAMPSEVDNAADWRSSRAAPERAPPPVRRDADDATEWRRGDAPPQTNDRFQERFGGSRSFGRRDDDDDRYGRKGDDRYGPPRGGGRDDDRYGPPRGGGRDDDRYGPPRGGGRDDDRYGPPRGGGRDDDRYGPPRGGGRDDDRYAPPRRGGDDDRYQPPRRGGDDDRYAPPRRGGDDDRYGPPRGGGGDRFGRREDAYAPRDFGDRGGGAPPRPPASDRFARSEEDRYPRRDEGPPPVPVNDRFACLRDEPRDEGPPVVRRERPDDAEAEERRDAAGGEAAAAAADAAPAPLPKKEEDPEAAAAKAAEWKAERESSGYKPLAQRQAEARARREEEAKRAAEEAAKPAPEPEKPKEYRPKKVKKLDPNVKLDPFGNARPMTKDPTIEGGTSAAAKPAATTAPAAAGDKPVAKASVGKFVPVHLRGRLPGAGTRTAKPGGKYDPDAVIGGKLQKGAVPTVVTENKAAGSIWAKKKPAIVAEVAMDGKQMVNLASSDESALEAAVKAGEGEVGDEEFAASLARLDLSSADTRAGLTAVLVASVGGKALSLGAVAVAVEECKCDPDTVQPLLTAVLEKVREAKGEDELVQLVADSGVDAGALLGSLSADLACLQGGPDVGAMVDEAFAGGGDAAAVLKIVHDNVDPAKVDVSFLAPRVAKEAMLAVFAVRNKADADALASFAELLKVVSAGSTKAQCEVVLSAHSTWFAKGKARGLLKPVFKQMLDLGLVEPASFVAWKEDSETKKVKGKKEAIIQNIAFLKEMEAEASKKFDTGAGDDDDEGDEDQ